MKNLAERTLLYGYTCDRQTWHVYCANDESIFLSVYGDKGQKFHNVTQDGIPDLGALVPDKRLYPQYCDFEFCQFLQVQGVKLPFTVWIDPTDRGQFAGETY